MREKVGNVPQRWLVSEEALGLHEDRRLLLPRFGLFFDTQMKRIKWDTTKKGELCG